MVRIDDRLIHGQVAAVWTKQCSIEQIIIVNDEVAEDRLQQSVQQMAAPANVKVAIFHVQEFVRIIKNKVPIKRQTMVLFTNPIDILTVINEGGGLTDKIVIGGMRSKAERRMIDKSVFVSDREDQAFKELIHKGIEIVILAVPTDPEVKYEKLEKVEK